MGNVNVMFTDVHGGQPPSGLEWYIRKGGITSVLEGVTSRLHIVEASAEEQPQEQAPAAVPQELPATPAARAPQPENDFSAAMAAAMVRAEALLAAVPRIMSPES